MVFQERLLAEVAAVLSFAVNRAGHTRCQQRGFSRTAPNTALALGAKQHVFFAEEHQGSCDESMRW